VLPPCQSDMGLWTRNQLNIIAKVARSRRHSDGVAGIRCHAILAVAERDALPHFIFDPYPLACCARTAVIPRITLTFGRLALGPGA
jgi:hypothetical protein